MPNIKIEHIAMYVNDLEGAKEFFEKYFNAKSNEKYNNIKTGFQSYFLSFDGGARLEIMSKPNVEEDNKYLIKTGYSHLAFSVGNREKVDNLTAQLKSDGFSVISGPRVTGDGYYESCVLGFENNLIEITE
jgi:lactoylglutathione lyase